MHGDRRPRFAAVIFDCDGVLVDSEVLAIRGERTALAELGLDYTPEEYVRRFVGLHDGQFFDQLRTDYRAAHGRSASADFEEKVLAGRRREMPALTAIEGAATALAATRAAALAIAVASSSRAPHLESKLRRTALYDLVAPHVYSADLVARGKPAPDVFLYTAEKLEIAASQCLVLEDSVNGVKAGLAAGMTVWGFTGGGHCFDRYGERLAEAGAATVVASFRDFIDQLRSE